MASQISHVVVNRVIGMARHRSQVAQNLTMKSYPRVRLKGSFLNAEKSKPQGLQIPFFLNIKLENNTHFMRSNADRLRPFTAFGVRLPFGCELSNSRMPMNVFNNGLTGGACSFYFGSTTRLFSQISKTGTQHNVVCTQGKVNGTHYLPKPSDKRLKSPKAFAAEKNEASTYELASKGSQSKDNGTNYLHKTSNERLKSPKAFAAEKNESSMHELASKGSQRKDNGTNYLHKTSNKCLKSPKAFATEKNEASMHELASKGSQSKDNGTNYLHKTSNKRLKSPRAFGAKKNETSVHELESNRSQGKVADSKDVKLSSLNGAKADENFFAVRSTQTPKGKDQGKQRPRSKRKQNQSLSSSASKADGTPDSSAPNIQAKESKNNKTKQSHSSLKINSASSTQKEATHNNTSTKTAGMEAVNLPANKGNNNTHSSSRSDEKHTVQSGNKVSAGGESPHNRTMSRKQKTWPQLYPPITKSVVVVESVAKADIIQAYLGEMFEVLPSYGHVRDLAARSGSVRPDDDFSMVWEVPSPAWSHLKSIKVALSGAENLILASDPDREGEAIAWHIIEMLKQQDALREDVTVARVTFNEITEPSIKSALQSPRAINLDLVHAYLSRRALDYLIGFNVSPLLWRKLPGCQSAGRVQSAALALLCDREKEINDFKAQEYWTINAHFQMKNLKSANNVSLPFHLTHFDSKNLQLLSISSNTNAKGIEEKINLSTFEVNGAKPSKIQKKPPTPYMTASLLQDAANKFNFTGSHTMKIAQKLYEGVQLSDGKATGLITYMRTDGFHISDEAANDIQSFIRERYGLNFTSKSPHKYFKKVKNAEEAHEAIRPTDIRRLPSMLAGLLDEESLKLYTLVWARTMACQMEPAVIEQIQCDIGNVNQSIMFRASSSRVGFPGFQAVYQDAEAMQVRDNEDEKSNHNETFKVLSNLQRGKPLSLIKVESEQHYTQPPPRYSEGSLVKKLEELGMGRPSTYATTIKVLKDRNYIKIKSSTIYPEFRGRMVSAFLSHYFSEVSDYSFTADMETEIDNVSAGTTEWKGLLKDYWSRFSKYCESANKVHVHSVEKIVEKALGNALFSSLPDGDRTCPSCLAGTLAFKVGRFGVGYFIACDQLPQCKYIAKTLYGEDDDDHDTEDKKKMEEPTVLGICPGMNEKVLLKCGPFGHYVQLGEDRKGHLPKRASLAHIKDANSITLEDALDLLQYPVTLGKHPDDNHPVILRLGRFGFAVKHRRSLCPVPKNLKPSDITIEKAFELLRSKDVRKCGRPKRQPVVATKAV